MNTNFPLFNNLHPLKVTKLLNTVRIETWSGATLLRILSMKILQLMALILVVGS